MGLRPGGEVHGHQMKLLSCGPKALVVPVGRVNFEERKPPLVRGNCEPCGLIGRLDVLGARDEARSQIVPATRSDRNDCHQDAGNQESTTRQCQIIPPKRNGMGTIVRSQIAADPDTTESAGIQASPRGIRPGGRSEYLDRKASMSTMSCWLEAPHSTFGVKLRCSPSCSAPVGTFDRARGALLRSAAPGVINAPTLVDPDGYRLDFESPTDVAEDTVYADPV